MKEYTATGNWSNTHYDVNLSVIFSEMIEEAAKCKGYASDVIYDIEHIKNFLNEKELNKKVLIAFRDYGTDRKNIIALKIKDDTYDVDKNYYRALFVVEFETDREKLNVTLKEYRRNVLNQVKKELK